MKNWNQFSLQINYGYLLIFNEICEILEFKIAFIAHALALKHAVCFLLYLNMQKIVENIIASKKSWNKNTYPLLDFSKSFAHKTGVKVTSGRDSLSLADLHIHPRLDLVNLDLVNLDLVK